MSDMFKKSKKWILGITITIIIFSSAIGVSAITWSIPVVDYPMLSIPTILMLNLFYVISTAPFCNLLNCTSCGDLKSNIFRVYHLF